MGLIGLRHVRRLMTCMCQLPGGHRIVHELSWQVRNFLDIQFMNSFTFLFDSWLSIKNFLVINFLVATMFLSQS